MENAKKFSHSCIIIPVLNEEKSIAAVLQALPKGFLEIIVVDNGCTDSTPEIARNLGATILKEPRKGYGAACLKGISALNPKTEIVVFMDGDYSDFPEEINNLIAPIINDNYDMVIGSRVLGASEKGALLPVARFGNWLSTRLIYWGWGFQYTDLGPFRSIRYAALKKINMVDQNFGWTVEMQVKALNLKLKIIEVPVSYRKRLGQSKISGTLLGSIKAGHKILWTIGREWLKLCCKKI